MRHYVADITCYRANATIEADVESDEKGKFTFAFLSRNTYITFSFILNKCIIDWASFPEKNILSLMKSTKLFKYMTPYTIGRG